MRFSFWILLICLSKFCYADVNVAETYYVSPRMANDLGDGKTRATAKKTLQAGLNLLDGPGDILNLMPGTYPMYTVDGGGNKVVPIGANNGFTVSFKGVSGTATLPIKIKALQPRSVILEGDDNLSGADTQNMLNIGNTTGPQPSNYVIVEGIDFIRSGGCGMKIMSSNNVTVRNCRFTANNKSGIILAYAGPNIVIENCISSYNMQEHGYYDSASGDGVFFRNCVSHHNSSNAYQMNGSPSSMIPSLGAEGDGIIDGGVITACQAYENGSGVTSLGIISPFFPNPIETGTITSAVSVSGASTITDTSKSWTTGQHSKYYRAVQITSGSLSGTTYGVQQSIPNTSNTLTTDVTFSGADVTALVGATYKILHAPAQSRGAGSTFNLLNVRHCRIENNVAWNEHHKILVWGVEGIGVVIENGTVSSATSNTLTVNSASWVTNVHSTNFRTVKVSKSGHTTTTATIASNTSNVITISGSWAETPDSTWSYLINEPEEANYYSADNIFQHNTCFTLSGVAIQATNGAVRCRVAFNVLSANSGTGIFGSDSRAAPQGSSFLTLQNTSDYNYIVNAGSGNGTKIHGWSAGSGSTSTFAAWQSAGNDVNGFNSLPTFVKNVFPFNFHPVGGSPALVVPSTGVYFGAYSRSK